MIILGPGKWYFVGDVSLHADKLYGLVDYMLYAITHIISLVYQKKKNGPILFYFFYLLCMFSAVDACFSGMISGLQPNRYHRIENCQGKGTKKKGLRTENCIGINEGQLQKLKQFFIKKKKKTGLEIEIYLGLF